MCFGTNCPYENAVSGECDGRFSYRNLPDDAACSTSNDDEKFIIIDGYRWSRFYVDLLKPEIRKKIKKEGL